MLIGGFLIGSSSELNKNFVPKIAQNFSKGMVCGK